MIASAPFSSPALRTLASRGYVEQASDLAGLDAALSAGPVTFYVGVDPTAASLHIGHLVPIMAMRVLQRFGHRPIAVLGGGTAMVGDPSGKSEMRRMLDRHTIEANSAAIHQQLGHYLDFDSGRENVAVAIDNAAWLLELNYVEFLREIGVHFTVNRMIATKTYRDRLDQEQPLSFLEFNYQLLQAYDFLQLHQRYDCALQLGGNDQWGNMIAGVELIRRVAQGSAHALTQPLLTTADGKKMGKTERGAVWLDPERLSSFDFFQYWIGVDDRDVEKLLLLYTDVPEQEVHELCARGGAALREAKLRLANETTAMLHGPDAAEAAVRASAQAFGGSDDWSAVPAITLEVSEIRVIDLLTAPQVGAFESKRQARQRLDDGAVRIDGEIQRDGNALLSGAEQPPEGFRLQAGKRVRHRVLLRP